MTSNRDGEQLLTQQNLETWAHQSQDLSKAALAREVLKLRNRIMIMDMFPPPDSSTQKVEGLEVSFLERNRKHTYNPWQESLKVNGGWYMTWGEDVNRKTVFLTEEEKWVYDLLPSVAAREEMLNNLYVVRNNLPPSPDPQQPARPFVREKGLWPKWRGKGFWSSLGCTTVLGCMAWLMRGDLFVVSFFGTATLIAATSMARIWAGKNE